MKRKIAYIGFAFMHHKETHAGYHQIKEFLSYDKCFDIQKFYEDNFVPRKRNILKKIISWINRKFFGSNDIPLYLLACILYGHINENTLFHFVYGENSLKNIKPFLNSKNKIVCTFHQPFDWFIANPQFFKYLKIIDAIILVGNKEIEKFSSVTGKKNVFYIPHGVCSDFYKPEPFIKKEHMLLTVGNWLRDYNFANKVYRKLIESDAELQINIVSSLENEKCIDHHPRIHFLRDISDDVLKNLYCRCSVLYLPLIRFTANNALLEAAATGCNIVISSDFADNSYIPEKFISVSKMDVQETVKKIQASMSLCYNYELSEYVKENYSWNIVAKLTMDILNSL